MYYNSITARVVSGVSKAQLQHWDELGIVKPTVPASGRGTRRLYSFEELVQLRTAKVLKAQGLSLSRLRKSMVQLRKMFPDVDKSLKKLTFLTDGKEIFILDRKPKALLDVLNEQFAISIPFGKVVEELKALVAKLSSERELSVKVQGVNYNVTLSPDPEDGGYMVECPAFNAFTQGETEQEAIDNIIDAIEAYLEVDEELSKEGAMEAAG